MRGLAAGLAPSRIDRGTIRIDAGRTFSHERASTRSQRFPSFLVTLSVIERQQQWLPEHLPRDHRLAYMVNHLSSNRLNSATGLNPESAIHAITWSLVTCISGSSLCPPFLGSSSIRAIRPDG